MPAASGPSNCMPLSERCPDVTVTRPVLTSLANGLGSTARRVATQCLPSAPAFKPQTTTVWPVPKTVAEFTPSYTVAELVCIVMPATVNWPACTCVTWPWAVDHTSSRLATPRLGSAPRCPCTPATMPRRRSSEVAATPSICTMAPVSSNLMPLTITLPKPAIAPCAKTPVPPVPGSKLTLPPPPQPASADAAKASQLRRVMGVPATGLLYRFIYFDLLLVFRCLEAAGASDCCTACALSLK